MAGANCRHLQEFGASRWSVSGGCCVGPAPWLPASPAYVAAFAVGFFMWQAFGGDPAGASRWILAMATCCAVLAGAFTAARDARKTAALALWLLSPCCSPTV